MSQEILMPKIGFSVNEAKFIEWMVQDGEVVNEGDPLFSIETEKAIEEIPSPVSGVVKQIAVPDEDYEVGAVLGTIE